MADQDFKAFKTKTEEDFIRRSEYDAKSNSLDNDIKTLSSLMSKMQSEIQGTDNFLEKYLPPIILTNIYEIIGNTLTRKREWDWLFQIVSQHFTHYEVKIKEDWGWSSLDK